MKLFLSFLVLGILLPTNIGLGRMPLLAYAATINGGLVSPTNGTVTQDFLQNTGNYTPEIWFNNYYDQNNIIQPRTVPEHSGVDISNTLTDCTSPVYAAAGGTVIWAGFDNENGSTGFGWSVVVRNGYNIGGNGEYIFTLYGHMGTVGTTSTASKSCLKVKTGQTVNGANNTNPTLIGYQGSSGLNVEASHVHFTVFVGPTDYTKALKSPYVSKYIANTWPASPDPYFCAGLTQGDTSFASSLTLGDNSCPSNWINTYAGINVDTANVVTKSSDGGYVYAGVSTSFGRKNNSTTSLWVVKLNRFGNIMWQKVFPGDGGYGHVNGILASSDGGYIINLGGGNSNGCYVNILKIDNSGMPLWQEQYGVTNTCTQNSGSARYVQSIIHANDGGYIAAGFDFSRDDGNVWIFKFDDNGNVIWSNFYGIGTDSVFGYDIAPIQNGYAIVGIDTPYGATNSNGLFFTIDNQGVVQAIHTLYNGITRLVTGTSDGGYIIAGEATYPWLTKLDSSGNVIWSNYYATQYSGAEFTNIEQTSSGNYVATISGYNYNASSPDNAQAVTLLSLDPTGIILWQKNFNNLFTSQSGNGSSLVQTNDGDYLMPAENISGSTVHASVIKTDQNGNVGQNCNVIVNASVGGASTAIASNNVNIDTLPVTMTSAPFTPVVSNATGNGANMCLVQ